MSTSRRKRHAMKVIASAQPIVLFLLVTTLVVLGGLEQLPARAQNKAVDAPLERTQAPNWSADDFQFFLHGSLGTEVVPENVLKAFRATYPDLLPGRDLTAFGLFAEDGNDLPIGVSRRRVPHLGNLTCIGINCASCHVSQIAQAGSGKAVRVLGATSHFDVEAFLGTVAAATFQTAVPANMSRFLKNYLEACDPQVSTETRELLATELARQCEAIAKALASHQTDERKTANTLYELDPETLTLDERYLQKSRDLTPVVYALLRLFHNMRIALHIPQQPPEKSPPLSGPGRNDAFGSLSEALFGEKTVYSPVKYGLVWNLQKRNWVHWDGNTRSPIIRNLAASLGLGAPLIGKRGNVDFALIERQTRISEQLLPPRYPWKTDAAAAKRGRAHFETHCASCHVHGQSDEDKRLCSVEEVKTDPNRASLFNAHIAHLFNRFFDELEVQGFKSPSDPALRHTGKYVAVDLAGSWARAPYLHNGSVRTMKELLTPPAQRAKKYHRGSRIYDETSMGFMDEGAYLFDTTVTGNSNAGHDYGTTDLTTDQKRDLIEYLKTL